MKLGKLLFFLFFLTLASQLGIHFWPEWALVFGVRVDYLSPAFYLSDIVGFALLFVYRKSIPLRPLILIFIFALVNTLSSQVFAVTATAWLRYFYFAALLLIICSRAVWIKKNIFWPLGATLFFTTLLGIAQMILGRSVGGGLYFLGERSFTTQTIGIALGRVGNFTFLRPYATIPHPNAFAGFLLVGMIILYWSRPKHKFLFPLLFICVVGIILSFSQGAWIALVIIAGLALVPKSILSRGTHILLSISVIISLLLPVVSHSLNTDFLSRTIKERITLSQLAAKAASADPLLGVGLNGFIPAVAQGIRQPVHNIWLLMFAEMGLVGVVIVFVYLKKIINNQDKPLLLALNAILITGLVDHYWLTLLQPQLLSVLVLGLMCRGTIGRTKK